jgi:hypothetical protein
MSGTVVEDDAKAIEALSKLTVVTTTDKLVWQSLGFEPAYTLAFTGKDGVHRVDLISASCTASDDTHCRLVFDGHIVIKHYTNHLRKHPRAAQAWDGLFSAAADQRRRSKDVTRAKHLTRLVDLLGEVTQ